MKKVWMIILVSTMSTAMTGCAPGAAISSISIASGYSLKSGTADSLSSEYEQHLVYRVKTQMQAEMQAIEKRK